MLKYVDTELLNSGGSRAVEDFMCQPEARHLLVLQVSVATGSRGGTRPESPQAAAWAIAGRSGARRMVAAAALRAYVAAVGASSPTDLRIY